MCAQYHPMATSVITHKSTVESEAVKSACGQYRYRLSRIWNREFPINAFLCANPSVADELVNDETALKCGNLAIKWNWGGFHLVNLYPYCSTDPSGVFHDNDADRINAEQILKVIKQVEMVVLACGNLPGSPWNAFIKDVCRDKLYCLKRNAGGGFQHPSRIKVDDFPSPIPAFG